MYRIDSLRSLRLVLFNRKERKERKEKNSSQSPWRKPGNQPNDSLTDVTGSVNFFPQGSTNGLTFTPASGTMGAYASVSFLLFGGTPWLLAATKCQNGGGGAV